MRIAIYLSFLLVAQISFAVNGVLSIPDVRVAPLVQTRWGQTTDTGYSNVGSPCFNLYTPENMPCGCSATVMAQILRYWQYPANAPAGDYPCSVNGKEVSLSVQPGAYDWANMPYDTRAGVSAVECAAIGKLTHDCSVALHTMFAPDSSYASSDASFSILKESFGYANAMGYCPMGGVRFEDIKGAVFASLDIGAPVAASLLTQDDVGHQVLIDGYGFDGDIPYVHILFGWPANSDACDCWYALPNVCPRDEYDFTKVDGVIYNIFPEDVGDVLSGRVLDEGLNPVSGAEVTVSANGVAAQTVVTDEKGIYAFLLPGGKTYSVVCGKSSKRVLLPKSSSAVCSWINPFMPAFSAGGVCGNSWGNDIVLSGADPEEDDDFGPFNPVKAVSGKYPFCGVVRAADGSVFGTISFKVGKASRKGLSKVTGTLVGLDGKKYTAAGATLTVNERSSVSADGIVVKKLGTMALTIGERGFSAVIVTESGVLNAETADLSSGLAVGERRFSVSGLPERVGEKQVLKRCSPDGEVITVNATGKWQLDKAATVKYKKIAEKDPVTGKRVYHYELQGLDDPLKPNVSGLKLTYKATAGTFKGSFNLYYDSGTETKPKVTKLPFTVNGIVFEGKGVGLAVCKKLAISLPVAID